jgi:excisionase family DNA binding protein
MGLTAGELLTPDQLAARWQVPVMHVYRLAREGKLPCVRLGKYVRFRAATIEAWEERGGTLDTGREAA